MIAMLARVFRWRLALMNGVSTAAGFLLFPHEAVQWRLLAAVFVAVSLLAAGSSALNQLLERDLDLLMERTRNRPLPQGDLSPKGVALLGAASLAAGSFLLFFTAGGAASALAGGAVSCYLGAYTPLKRRTGLSLLLGAACGAVPPLIGWSSAGGSLPEFAPLLLALLLYLWQVPHFWLLQRRHAEDYRRAGFKIFAISPHGMNPAPFLVLWITAIVAATMMFPLFGVIPPAGARASLFFSAPLMLLLSRRLERALFAYLNLFPLLFTAALLVP